jgi:hypothetical protein
MKISVFGKSGPRLVIFGLVSACAATDPATIQPSVSAITNARILFGILCLPLFFLAAQLVCSQPSMALGLCGTK